MNQIEHTQCEQVPGGLVDAIPIFVRDPAFPPVLPWHGLPLPRPVTTP